jgi:hypothetical protein
VQGLGVHQGALGAVMRGKKHAVLNHTLYNFKMRVKGYQRPSNPLQQDDLACNSTAGAVAWSYPLVTLVNAYRFVLKPLPVTSHTGRGVLPLQEAL